MVGSEQVLARITPVEECWTGQTLNTGDSNRQVALWFNIMCQEKAHMFVHIVDPAGARDLAKSLLILTDACDRNEDAESMAKEH